jgi:hypothetical protein
VERERASLVLMVRRGGRERVGVGVGLVSTREGRGGE